MAAPFLTVTWLCVGCPHSNKTFWQFCSAPGPLDNSIHDEPYDDRHEEYDRSSPTKQNIMCEGRAATEVIAASCGLRDIDAGSDFNDEAESELDVDTRNYVTLPSPGQHNFVTISPSNKLRRLTKYGSPAQESTRDGQWAAEQQVTIQTRAVNDYSVKLYNHGEGPYKGLLLVESAY